MSEYGTVTRTVSPEGRLDDGLSVRVATEELGWTVVTVVGEVDHATAGLLAQMLTRCWAEWPVAVTIDLRQVTFCNAAGLRALLLSSRTARVRGVPLRFRTAGHVQRLLEIVGLRAGLSPVPESGLDDHGPVERSRRPERPELRLLPDLPVPREPLDDAVDRWRPEAPVSALIPLQERAAAPVGPGGTSAGLVASLRALDAASGDVAATCRAITDQAVTLVTSAQQAGISHPAARSPHRSPPRDAAPTDDVARLVQDVVQRHSGPCGYALALGQTVHLPDVLTELRWPLFTRMVADLGVRSLLVLVLSAHERTLGALVLTANTPGAFDAASRQSAEQFAALGASALAAVDQRTGLEQALLSRDVIGQAKGILMHQYRITAEAAFDVLRRASSERNVRLVVLAERVARSGQL